MNEANRMNTPYWNDPEVRKQIDDVLRACAGRFAALGQDSTKAEREAAKECGLRYVYNGVGTLGTKNWAGAHQYITTEEYNRLNKLPYWGYCKICGTVRNGGYCSDNHCKESFFAKYGYEPNMSKELL